MKPPLWLASGSHFFYGNSGSHLTRSPDDPYVLAAQVCTWSSQRQTQPSGGPLHAHTYGSVQLQRPVALTHERTAPYPWNRSTARRPAAWSSCPCPLAASHAHSTWDAWWRRRWRARREQGPRGRDVHHDAFAAVCSSYESLCLPLSRTPNQLDMLEIK
jgi:hypothetical protein